MTQSQTSAMLNQKKTRFIKYFSFSALLLCLAYVIATNDPLERLIEDQLSMRNGSFIYYLWQKPPLPVIMSVYIFNITNAEAFMKGIDKKLKVVEVGPYVYQEILENTDPRFNENGTLSFVPKRHSIPLPDRSIGDPNKDIIITANLPLLGLSTAAAKMSVFTALAASTLAKSTSARAILNLTVHDYLWGYEDNLVRLANTIVPNYINFDRFGLLDRLFDEGHNLVSMNLPKAVTNMKEEEEVKQEAASNEVIDHPESAAQVSNHISDVEYEAEYEDELEKFNSIPSMAQQIPKPESDAIRDFSIDSWNGSPGLEAWGYENNQPEKNSRCNTLRGAFDGTLFPKHITNTSTFKIYRKAFCRTLTIHYSHSGKQYGIDAYWFKLAENAFDDSVDDPETSCYCKGEKTCMKRGLGNITPCYYNIPVAVSLPHFYNSDPTLLHEVEGLKPIKEKHENIIIMQPRLGVPIKVHSRMQLNLINGVTKFNSDVKKFDNLILPVCWVEIAIEKLTPQLDIILNLAFNVLPHVQTGTVVLLLLAGIYYLVKMLLNFFYFVAGDSRKFESIKYTAVFPYIKKEMAKFDDRDRSIRIESV